MSTYVVGDVQGCCDALQRLLDKIKFNPVEDQIYFAGDLVNRGPDSLGTLRTIMKLGDSANSVLGNHDLHLLAVAHECKKAGSKDTITDILDAPDRKQLLTWLANRPLIITLPVFNAVITHAGIPPLWSIKKASKRAHEVEEVLRSDQAANFFQEMYGNQPAGWSKHLTGMTRLRVITNYFTRMRFVNQAGELDLGIKGTANMAPEGFFPWFEHPHRKATDTTILFGHWAALEGVTGKTEVQALDTGCVWGGSLTALRLEDGKRVSVAAE